MQTFKSQDGLLVNTLTALFQDAGKMFSMRRVDLDTTTDYLLKRLSAEGPGFLTKTLPSFGKHFDACLQEGQLTPFPGLKTGKGISPLIFKGLIELVFSEDGTLLNEADINVIRFIRQVSFMFYKLEGAYPTEIVEEKIDEFVETDKLIPEYLSVTPAIAAVAETAQDVVRHLFLGFEHGDILPCPGPGQNASHRERYTLYEPVVKYRKLHEKYPYYKYFYCGTPHLLDRVHSYRAMPVHDESVSLLACVPKDSRGPRLICMEPPEFMWIQQGLGRKMVQHLESHRMSRGQVNFTDQTINGELARVGSETQMWATLDMKEASDRIGRDLVAYLFDGVPALRDALLSATTDWVLTPRGAIRKRKFASMGSALCFPVMSVVHYALGLAAISVETGRSTMALAKSLYVYGDDLIVRTEYADHLLRNFPDFGLKFNQSKCCVKGSFRESCGVDAFKGHTITPLRVKKISLSKKDGTSIQSALAVFHGLLDRGLWCTARVWQEWISATVSLPCVSDSSSALGWVVPKRFVTAANVETQRRYNKRLQCFEYKVPCLQTRSFPQPIGDWERLLKSVVHTHQGDSSRFAPRSSVLLRWKWVPLASL